MVESDGIIFDPEQASKGAWQGIRRVTGHLLRPSLVKSPFKITVKDKNGEHQEDDPKQQIEVKLCPAEIVEMEPGEIAPDLKEDTFSIKMPYAMPGAKPHTLSFYVAGFSTSGKMLARARGLGKDATWQNLIDTDVTIEYVKDFVTGKMKDKETKKEVECKSKGWVFVTEEGNISKEDIKDHVKNLVIGNKPSAAKRALMIDTRTKRDPKWKAAIDDGSIEKLIGVKLDADGKYEDAAPKEEPKEEKKAKSSKKGK